MVLQQMNLVTSQKMLKLEIGISYKKDIFTLYKSGFYFFYVNKYIAFKFYIIF